MLKFPIARKFTFKILGYVSAVWNGKELIRSSESHTSRPQVAYSKSLFGALYIKFNDDPLYKTSPTSYRASTRGNSSYVTLPLYSTQLLAGSFNVDNTSSLMFEA